MSIAAVPAYLGQEFKDASPGMRFGMYLAIWTSRADQEKEINQWAKKGSPEAREIRRVRDQQGMDAAIAHARRRRNFPRLWEKNDFASRKVWKEIVKLTDADQAAIKGILARYAHCATTLGEESVLAISARSTAPFTTGLGNEHPLENGFAFLWPYGIPYLPGSGVKGVLRQAARELASAQWGEQGGWDDAPTYDVRDENGKVIVEALSVIDLLFGLESRDGQKEHFRGVLTFWDVVPKIREGKLMVEIMTPHQAHYYQNGEPPHDSGQPVPIQFLTVPPGSEFQFHVVCDTARLRHIAPDLLEEIDGKPRWKVLIEAAFKHAFEWLGFGAKTAVGYGVMQAGEASEAGGSVAPIAQSEERWEHAVLTFRPGSQELKATRNGEEALLVGADAKKLVDELKLSKNQQKKLKQTGVTVHVTVTRKGNQITIVSVEKPNP